MQTLGKHSMRIKRGLRFPVLCAGQIGGIEAHLFSITEPQPLAASVQLAQTPC